MLQELLFQLYNQLKQLNKFVLKEEKQEKSRRSTTQDTVPSEDIANVIQGISEENLRAFLLELCSEDERIKNRVLLKYSASVSGTQLMNLQQELEEISERYSDRYGCISWDRTAEYEFEIVDFLDDNVTILVERNCVMEAFELLKETLYHVGEQDFDDSNGTSSEIASFIYACFTSVLKAGSPTEKETTSTCLRHGLKQMICPNMQRI